MARSDCTYIGWHLFGQCLLLFLQGSFSCKVDGSDVEPPIVAIEFTTDGTSVAVGSQAGIALYDWPELVRRRNIPASAINIHAIAFSPSGTSLVVAGGVPSEYGVAEVFAWPSAQRLYTTKGHADSVLAVAWLDDQTFATASIDHEIAIWKVGESQPIRQLRGHSRGVSAICYLREDDLIVSGSLDQSLRVWNVEQSLVLRTLNNHTRGIVQITARPATTGLPMIASIGEDRTVRFWQPTIGRLVRFARLDETPLAARWKPDGTQLAVSSDDGHVRLIDPDTAQTIEDLPAVEGWAYCLCVHPTDGSLLVGGRNGQLKRVVPAIRP